MKRFSVVVICLVFLSGCGQSNEERAKEFVRLSCESTSIPKTESLIRQAVDLDEKYRPYLIAWLNWQSGTEELLRASKLNREAYEFSYKDFKENFTIQDSYCN
jgi:hypothetical protein